MRASLGRNAGTANTAGLPNITGYAAASDEGGVISWPLFGTHSGALDTEMRPLSAHLSSVYGALQTTVGGINIDASRSSKIYGNSVTVIPDSINIPIIIYLGK